jgi:ribosomal protein S9
VLKLLYKEKNVYVKKDFEMKKSVALKFIIKNLKGMIKINNDRVLQYKIIEFFYLIFMDIMLIRHFI